MFSPTRKGGCHDPCPQESSDLAGKKTMIEL